MIRMVRKQYVGERRIGCDINAQDAQLYHCAPGLRPGQEADIILPHHVVGEVRRRVRSIALLMPGPR